MYFKNSDMLNDLRKKAAEYGTDLIAIMFSYKPDGTK